MHPISTNQKILSIELLVLEPHIDGTSGSNRASVANPPISANTDIEAIKAWLAKYVDSAATFNSYRKEAERLLLWCTYTLGKALSSLTHEDLLLYKRFIQDPAPRALWLMTNQKVSRGNPNWRPFAGSLSSSSQRQAIVILNSMFSWLVNAGYLAGNPLSLSRQRKQSQTARITRYLDEDLWLEVKMTIEGLPRESFREREHYSRSRWLFSLFYITGIRISEVVNNSMGCFFQRKNKDGDILWWLEITGKGKKIRLVPATSELMAEVQRYRSQLGLSHEPIEGEVLPLVFPIGGQAKPMTRAGVHLVFKKVFQLTAERLASQGDTGKADIEKLNRASAHWLRHTAGSRMANAMDLRLVRDNLGHKSINTTNIYLHIEDDKRHEEMEKIHSLEW